jgi:hypothetical protein
LSSHHLLTIKSSGRYPYVQHEKRRKEVIDRYIKLIGFPAFWGSLVLFTHKIDQSLSDTFSTASFSASDSLPFWLRTWPFLNFLLFFRFLAVLPSVWAGPSGAFLSTPRNTASGAFGPLPRSKKNLEPSCRRRYIRLSLIPSPLWPWKKRGPPPPPLSRRPLISLAPACCLLLILFLTICRKRTEGEPGSGCVRRGDQRSWSSTGQARRKETEAAGAIHRNQMWSSLEAATTWRRWGEQSELARLEELTSIGSTAVSLSLSPAPVVAPRRFSFFLFWWFFDLFDCVLVFYGFGQVMMYSFSALFVQVMMCSSHDSLIVF